MKIGCISAISQTWMTWFASSGDFFCPRRVRASISCSSWFRDEHSTWLTITNAFIFPRKQTYMHVSSRTLLIPQAVPPSAQAQLLLWPFHLRSSEEGKCQVLKIVPVSLTIILTTRRQQRRKNQLDTRKLLIQYMCVCACTRYIQNHEFVPTYLKK